MTDMRPCLPTGLPRAVPPSALLLLLLAAAARAAHSAHNDDRNQLLQELTGPAVLARARRRVLESRVTASLSSWPTLDSEILRHAEPTGTLIVTVATFEYVPLLQNLVCSVLSAATRHGAHDAQEAAAAQDAREAIGANASCGVGAIGFPPLLVLAAETGVCEAVRAEAFSSERMDADGWAARDRESGVWSLLRCVTPSSVLLSPSPTASYALKLSLMLRAAMLNVTAIFVDAGAVLLKNPFPRADPALRGKKLLGSFQDRTCLPQKGLASCETLTTEAADANRLSTPVFAVSPAAAGILSRALEIIRGQDMYSDQESLQQALSESTASSFDYLKPPSFLRSMEWSFALYEKQSFGFTGYADADLFYDVNPDEIVAFAAGMTQRGLLLERRIELKKASLLRNGMWTLSADGRCDARWRFKGFPRYLPPREYELLTPVPEATVRPEELVLLIKQIFGELQTHPKDVPALWSKAAFRLKNLIFFLEMLALRVWVSKPLPSVKHLEYVNAMLRGLAIAQMWRTARSKLHLDRSHADQHLLGQALSSFTNWALLLLRNSAEYLDQIHGSAELHGTETEIVLTRIRVDALKLLDEILQLEGMDRNNGEVDWPPAPAQATELILRGARSQLEHVEHAQ